MHSERAIAMLLASALIAAPLGLTAAQTPAPAKKSGTAGAAPQGSRPAAGGASGAAAEAGPSATSAVYGDWVVRCSQQAKARVCEVAQSIYLQGQQNPIALIAIGREKDNDPIRLVLQVPLNVTVSARATMSLRQGEPPIELKFERCIPAGCFAMLQPAEEAVRRLRAHSDPGRITYKDAADKDVGFQFSLRGLSPALDAWSKG
ncbi:MAG TPA: invasion associated locus B family protein [Xanthobacteraceae bacterium]